MLLNKPILCSISIVVYQPQLAVLIREFTALTAAFKKASEKLAVEFEIYIVDNSEDLHHASSIKDALQTSFAHLSFVQTHYVKSPKNLGYGYGNNLIIPNLNSHYHLVMNPDVFVEEDALLKAIEYLEAHPEIGLLTPAIFGEDGQRHYLCKLNPTLFDMFLRGFAPGLIKKLFHKRLTRFEMRDHNYEEEIKNIAYPSGCFMFFRSNILQQLNGFDERFFMYIEDADIGRRLLVISQSIYLPQVKIIHKWSRQTHAHIRFRWITVKSMLSYWWKYGGIY